MSELFCCKCATKCVTAMVYGEMREKCPQCGFVYFHNPIPGVAIILIDGVKIALVKRMKSEKWSIPCGCIEFGESFINAAVREVKEEVGIDSEPLKIVNVVSNTWTSSSSQANVGSSLAIVILSKPLAYALTADNAEVTDAQWFDITGTLPALEYDADKYIIGQLSNCLSTQSEISGILLSERQTYFTQL